MFNVVQVRIQRRRILEQVSLRCRYPNRFLLNRGLQLILLDSLNPETMKQTKFVSFSMSNESVCFFNIFSNKFVYFQVNFVC